MRIAKGEVVVICGPSGSGKSTLIKCIDGLEPFKIGTITVDGISVGDRATNLPKLRSRIGMVFQNFELFPHMTAGDIVLAQQKVLGRDRTAAKAKARELLERMGWPTSLPSIRPSSRAATAARRHRPRARHGSDRHAVRRADLGAGPGDHCRSAGRDGQAGRGGHDHGSGTHEMRFTRKVADRVVFMDQGAIVEDAAGGPSARPQRARAAVPVEDFAH